MGRKALVFIHPSRFSLSSDKPPWVQCGRAAASLFSGCLEVSGSFQRAFVSGWTRRTREGVLRGVFENWKFRDKCNLSNLVPRFSPTTLL